MFKTTPTNRLLLHVANLTVIFFILLPLFAVFIVDYYVLHDDAWYGFDRCEGALAELERRYSTLAEEDAGDNVVFADLGDVVTPALHPEAYALDNVHPSDAGAELLGAFLAARLKL